MPSSHISVSLPNEVYEKIMKYLRYKQSVGINNSKAIVTPVIHYMENVDINWQQEKMRHDEEETRLITAATLLDQKEGKKEKRGHKSHIPVGISLLSTDNQLEHFHKTSDSCVDCQKEVLRLERREQEEKEEEEPIIIKEEIIEVPTTT